MSTDKPKAPEFAPQTRLSVVYFRAAVNFGGEEKESVSVPSKSDMERGQRASNAVDAVLPGFVDTDARALLCSDTPEASPEGLVLIKRRHNLHTNKREEVRTFVPWSNVRSISYGE